MRMEEEEKFGLRLWGMIVFSGISPGLHENQEPPLAVSALSVVPATGAGLEAILNGANHLVSSTRRGRHFPVLRRAC